MQAAIRSVVATGLVLLWAVPEDPPVRTRRHPLAGIAAGLLFAFEFVFIYGGLAHTNASRMSVFVYLAPPLTALGLHFFVPASASARGSGRACWWRSPAWCSHSAEGFFAGAEHLARRPVRPDRGVPVGGDHGADSRHPPRRVSATKTLFYQLGVSALVLPIASFLLGERALRALNATGASPASPTRA